MRIIQISDLHLDLNDGASFGIDIMDRFNNLLSAIPQFEPDLVVLTGDISLDKPNQAVNDYVFRKLTALGVPFRVIAGNHDHSIQLAQAFQVEQHLHNFELYYSEVHDDRHCLFLDSSRARMSADQWEWFETELNSNALEKIIFIHHPPVYANCPYMDNNHAFIEQYEFEELCRKLPKKPMAFCGHYHLNKYVSTAFLDYFICPPLYITNISSSLEFEVDLNSYGFRIIDLNKDRMSTHTIQL